MQKMRQKNCSGADTHVNSQTLWHKTCPRLSQIKSQGMKWGSGHTVPPLPKKLFAFNTCWEGGISSLQWSVTVCINHTTRQAPCSREAEQHKTISMGFFFYVLFALLVIFVLSDFVLLLLIVLIFSFGRLGGFLRERQRERESTGIKLKLVVLEDMVWAGKNKKHNKDILYENF